MRLVFIALATAFLCMAGQPDPRGIFIAPAPNGVAHPAVKVRIELNRNGQSTPVASTYRFQSGDRFRLVFELNQPSYVYVVNRSIEGNPDALGSLLGTRGINVVNQGTAAKPAVPNVHLLWPPRGTAAQLAAGQPQSVPGAGQFFQFDMTPGLEKLAVLVSPYAVDPARFITGLPGASPPSGRRNREDTNTDVLSQLDDLRSLEGNTATDPGNSKGICVGDCSQYSASKNPAQPFVLTVDLLHAR